MTQFERDLHASAAFRELCLNDDFAAKLYCSLENQTWTRDPEGVESDDDFSCSFRYAGGLVAELRDKGEDYLDFYCGGPDGASSTVFPEVEAALATLGWYPVEDDKALNARQREPKG